MDTIIILLGTLTTVGGFGLLVHQTITYLSTQTWPVVTLMTAVASGPAPLMHWVTSQPGLASWCRSCPLWVALTVLGLVLLLLGYRLKHRYV